MPANNHDQAFLDILNLLTVDQLKPRFKSCPAAGTAPTRKAELISAIKTWLSGSGLALVWQSLSPLEQQAVRTSLYGSDGWFDERRFKAEFDSVPAWFTKRYHYYHTPAEQYKLGWFFYPPGRYLSGQRIPDWLQQRLKSLVSPPEVAVLSPCDLPTPLPDHTVIVERERAAARELRLMLVLLQEGELKVSDKTGLPGKALLQKLSSRLEEYYPDDPCEDAPGVAHIKAFGWIMLLQASRWVQRKAGRLVLTAEGLKQLSAPLYRTLRQLWLDWLDSQVLDEFSRIDIIKGQTGKGAQTLTPVPDRRHAIAAALTESPAGGWVSYPAFSRFMLTGGHEFEITEDVSAFYIYERHYGTLYHAEWEVLQGRYLRCVLLEYAATLGLIDVVLAPPQQPEPDYDFMWGADDLECLSRYDGLLYVRLNALGAYCLGLSKDYEDPSASRQTALTMQKGYRLQFNQPPSEAELLLIEGYADGLNEQGWQLSVEKMLTLLENGGSLTPLRDFIAKRDPQPYLPEDSEQLLAGCEANARAVTPAGTVLLLHCRDEQTATAIATHPLTAGLCQAAGDNRLLIEPRREQNFRRALHQAGYGMG
ncbi:hypothetical protein GCM10022421_16560 [Oceanisphaera sediminis]|uniref:Helicase XPB/Ssl2 N-terminal domain-containing protein n=1 Tax=Oceanisphaera sediminis TaxID=981381 RepID=A0ABP7DWE5_9GAMM